MPSLLLSQKARTAFLAPYLWTSGLGGPIPAGKTPAKYLHKNTEQVYSKWPQAVLGFCSATNVLNAPQASISRSALAKKAPAMRSHTNSEEPDGPQTDIQPEEQTDEVETAPEVHEDELDESNVDNADDDRWDAFILDDDGEPLPEYGDFWFPD